MNMIGAMLLGAAALSLILPAPAIAGPDPEPAGSRAEFWIDLYNGEPVPYADVLADLAGVDLVFIGEHHTIDRHHRWQKKIIEDLAAGGAGLVVGVEMLEHKYQPQLDSYAEGEIGFEQLAEETRWGERWGNYGDYREIFESVRKSGLKLLALNADGDVVRKVGRQGLEALDEKERDLLPLKLGLDDPPYFALLEMQMMVHAHVTEKFLKNMFAAQAARDAAMAEAMADYLKSPEGRGRQAVMLLGAGHCTYGYGTVSRLKARLPDADDRIVLMSESGDLVIPPELEKYAREVEVNHAQLRETVRRPPGDYLSVIEMKLEPPERVAEAGSSP